MSENKDIIMDPVRHQDALAYYNILPGSTVHIVQVV